jgi:hypothetical protein
VNGGRISQVSAVWMSALCARWRPGSLLSGNRSRIAALAALALLAGILVGPSRATAGGSSCGPSVNIIACENTKAGTPESQWDVPGTGDATIVGFTTDISVNLGQTVYFKIKTDASAYTIDIYRLGWYGGNGARKMASVSPSVSLPQSQPACVADPATEIYDCGTWAVSASWAVPSDAVSGVYVAKLTRTDTGGASQVPFVVRDDASTSDLLFQTSDATWQAYNEYGGSDFYVGAAHGRAYKLSYNRPFATRGAHSGRDYLFSNEYPMIRFLERNGYDTTYSSGVDSDRRGDLIRNHKVFVSVGHDEYWSGQQRANVEAARDAGVNLAFFSGNEVYWKTRWESSEDGTGTAYRTLVCYKETWANGKIDPSTSWTGTWRDPRFSPPADGARPENALTGTAYMANDDDAAIQVPAAQGLYRFWRNTDVATLAAAGQPSTLAQHTLGYESDEDLDNGFRPAGLVRLSTTATSTTSLLRDFGNTVTPGVTNHSMTLYRASSGALVFSAGTIQWAWGLDDDHDGLESPVDPRMQQATINLFADMGVQLSTPATGLSAAAASTDRQAPTVTISSPAAGTPIANGSQITIQGTAADTGGRVAGVEVSTDGGTTWHPAAGTTSWSYTFIASGMSNLAVAVRATDDSGNIQSTPSTRTFALTGPHSLFGERTPTNPSTNDSSAVEVGVKFKADTDGFVTAIRFYKSAGNTGTHTGTLWTGDGTRLATGTFSGETASGWQTMTLPTAVPITGNTTYVASYFAPSGNYAGDPWAFSYSGFAAAPLTAQRSLGSDGNGLFRYGGGFPTQSFADTNYYVDVLFTASQDAAPSVVSISPSDGSSYVAPSIHPSAVFSKAMDASTLQFTLTDSGNAQVTGTVAYDGTAKSATFTPGAALIAGRAYTATVQAQDIQGHPMDAPKIWSFTVDPDPNVSRLFAMDASPAVASANDSDSLELGVKFTPSTNGTVTGVRFYKGTGNTGAHTGSLWTLGGTLLARVTFSGETASGWQTAHFVTPVPVTAGVTYVASYYAPTGHYSTTSNFFTSTWSNGLLSAPATTNGLFRYGGDNFPNSSYQATNYWVDPLFVSDGTTAPTTISLFSDGDTPASANWDDSSAIEVGVRFSSDINATVTGVRFYKGPANTGTHTGSLWSASGQLLATATFTNETASGWQVVMFDQPVPITAGATYVASYHSTVGMYAVNINAFSGVSYDQGALHIPASGGAYRYGGGYPDSSATHNFWVDVLVRPN